MSTPWELRPENFENEEVMKHINDFLDGWFASIEALGEAREAARLLLRCLKIRGIELTSEQHDQIKACDDPRQVNQWVDRAFVAVSADDVFKDQARSLA